VVFLDFYSHRGRAQMGVTLLFAMLILSLNASINSLTCLMW
jgi:hypothetical protein